MAEQWQIRRGTTAENDDFTGAVGELTMDTDKNQIRLHDGSTQGGITFDPVVVFIKPTAGNNYAWARKYASGWVEQGFVDTSDKTVNLIVTMADSNYIVEATTYRDSAAGAADYAPVIHSRTTTSFYCAAKDGGKVMYVVKGMAA